MPSAASEQVAALLRAEMERAGSITFARWMEIALYHPNLGYYTRPTDPFGKSGDFYTAEQLAPFGDMIATVAARLRDQLSDTGAHFQVLELGAGRRDLRHALQPFDYHGHDHNSPALPERITGLVLANEFFDALPARVLRREEDGWRELTVHWSNGQFCMGQFCLIPSPSPLDETLQHYAEFYGAALPPGSVLEINVAMARWVERIAGMLKAGRLLVFDYGYRLEELPRFPDGTLMSYRRHTASCNVLANPGDRDITAHVNFTALAKCAGQHGLRLTTDASLRDWALRLWSEPALQQRFATHDSRWRMEWKQLVFGMGETFRVLEFTACDAR